MTGTDRGRHLLVLSFALVVLMSGTVRGAEENRVLIEYFREPGCPQCVRIDHTVLSKLSEKYGGFYDLRSYDIREQTNLVRLLVYQKHFKVQRNAPVSMYVDYRRALNGYDQIAGSLLDEVDAAISMRSDPGWHSPMPIAVPDDASLAAERVRGMTMGVVLLNGLLDGVNPCAIGTLIFLVSMLAVGGVSGFSVIFAGLGFCAGSFVAYLAIGVGLLGSLYLLSGFWTLRICVEWGMAVALVVVALISFRDAREYARIGNASNVILKLPRNIRLKINAMVRSHLLGGAFTLFVSGLGIGVGATCLEAVCTGQLYIPTLAFVIRNGDRTALGWVELISRAWGFLLAYNFAAICPALALIVCAYVGMRTSWFLRLARRYVVFVKVLTGIVLLLMAGLIVALA